SRGPLPFRKTPGTTRPERSPPSLSGRRPRSGPNISRIPALWSMREERSRVAAIGLALALSLFASTSFAGGTQDFAKIAAGRYLPIAGDCAACHTAEKGAALAGGRLIETPFGPMAAPNITSDQETGIGGWTDQQFIDAMTRGRRPSGSHLYPAMPY